jgi:regulator of cell morphogenesis and NO signaling
MNYPIDLIIEYLKHGHLYYLLSISCPYIGQLGGKVSGQPSGLQYDQVEKDLKILFPLFLEDFIHHIYEEEDYACLNTSTCWRSAAHGQGQSGPVVLY